MPQVGQASRRIGIKSRPIQGSEPGRATSSSCQQPDANGKCQNRPKPAKPDGKGHNRPALNARGPGAQAGPARSLDASSEDSGQGNKGRAGEAAGQEKPQGNPGQEKLQAKTRIRPGSQSGKYPRGARKGSWAQNESKLRLHQEKQGTWPKVSPSCRKRPASGSGRYKRGARKGSWAKLLPAGQPASSSSKDQVLELQPSTVQPIIQEFRGHQGMDQEPAKTPGQPLMKRPKQLDELIVIAEGQGQSLPSPPTHIMITRIPKPPSSWD